MYEYSYVVFFEALYDLNEEGERKQKSITILTNILLRQKLLMTLA